MQGESFWHADSQLTLHVQCTSILITKYLRNLWSMQSTFCFSPMQFALQIPNIWHILHLRRILSKIQNCNLQIFVELMKATMNMYMYIIDTTSLLVCCEGVLLSVHFYLEYRMRNLSKTVRVRNHKTCTHPVLQKCGIRIYPYLSFVDEVQRWCSGFQHFLPSVWYFYPSWCLLLRLPKNREYN